MKTKNNEVLEEHYSIAEELDKAKNYTEMVKFGQVKSSKVK